MQGAQQLLSNPSRSPSVPFNSILAESSGRYR